MAMDFLGQFDRDQYNEFLEFLEKEYENLDARISNLTTEIARTEAYVNKLDKAEAKLLEPYSKIRKIKYNDGTEEIEKEYRTKDSVLKDTLGLIVFEDGVHDDIDSSLIIRDMKKSIESAIKYKREKLEYTIKKAIDLIDQQTIERSLLIQRQKDIEFKKEQIEVIFQDPYQL